MEGKFRADPDLVPRQFLSQIKRRTSGVGDNIARVTRPIRVSDGVLLVAVRSSAWLMELRMMEIQILKKLNADAGRGKIDSIRFVMDSPED